MLNEIKIKEYCDMYGYEYRCFGCTALIMTGVDTWRLTSMETISRDGVSQCIKVEHANKYRNRSGKFNFHVQRIAYDIDWIFQNIIVPHQTYDRAYNKVFELKELISS